MVSRVVQQSKFMKLAERCHDGVVRGLVVDVEESGQLLCDFGGRSVPVTAIPDEARGRIELVDLLCGQVKYNCFSLYHTRTDIGSLLGKIVVHSLKSVSPAAFMTTGMRTFRPCRR